MFQAPNIHLALMNSRLSSEDKGRSSCAHRYLEDAAALMKHKGILAELKSAVLQYSCIVLQILLLLLLTFTQGIYNYIPKTNHDFTVRVYGVSAFL